MECWASIIQPWAIVRFLEDIRDIFAPWYQKGEVALGTRLEGKHIFFFMLAVVTIFFITGLKTNEINKSGLFSFPTVSQQQQNVRRLPFHDAEELFFILVNKSYVVIYKTFLQIELSWNFCKYD